MDQLAKALQEIPKGALPSNIVPNPREDVKAITTESGITLVGPSVPPPLLSSYKEVERDLEPTMDQVHISSSESTARVLSLVVQPTPISKPNEIPKRNPHQPPIPYPSRLNKEKLQDNSDIQIHKFLQMFKKLHFNIRDHELEKCMALADLGASINLLPLSMWKKLMLPELVPTHMTLELANWSVAYPAGIAEDVFMQVGKFTFPTDLFVVDYDVDPRVPFILGIPFLRTARALVDVYREEKLTFKVDSTLKYSHKYGKESINMIDIFETTCDDHFHKVLKFQKSIHPLSGNPTPSSDLVAASLSPSLTPFGDSDFLLEETDTLLSHFDHSIPDYEALCFDIDHQEEKSSGSTISQFDLSLLKYELFYFDLLIDPPLIVERSNSHHEEFADELAHIISPPEYDHFYFDIEVDLGELTRLLKENISSRIKEDKEVKS
ncbi:reverse transcriptase domain-containing protein [Tanacetum coccineum]